MTWYIYYIHKYGHLRKKNELIINKNQFSRSTYMYIIVIICNVTSLSTLVTQQWCRRLPFGISRPPRESRLPCHAPPVIRVRSQHHGVRTAGMGTIFFITIVYDTINRHHTTRSAHVFVFLSSRAVRVCYYYYYIGPETPTGGGGHVHAGRARRLVRTRVTRGQRL